MHFFLVLALSSLTPCAASQDDVAVVLDRLHAFVYGNGDCTQMSACTGPPEQTCAPALDYSAKMGSNGSWPDINYRDHDKSDWETVQHLDRVLLMARAYLTPQCSGVYKSSKILSQTHTALSFWLVQDFQNPNWWWNQFGVPQYMGSITVLLLPLNVLSAQEVNTIENMMLRAQGSFSGQNLVWSLQILSVRGLFMNNATEVTKDFNGIWQACSFANGADGVQPDGSFYQHGPLLQNGAYGADFALTLVVSVSLAKNTSFAMPLGSQNFNCLCALWLDGEQHMIRNNTWDVSVKGREMTRQPDGNQEVSVNPLIPAIMSLGQDSSVPRYQEWAALGRRMQGSEPALVGTRHFWWNDYTTHHRSSFFISLHSTSTRTYGAECVNGEGLLSWHMGDGVTFIYQSGDEYKGIFPVWDWTRLPGTTSVQGAVGTPCDVKKLGRTSFVGGVTDGVLGISTLDFLGNSWTSSEKETTEEEEANQTSQQQHHEFELKTQKVRQNEPIEEKEGILLTKQQVSGGVVDDFPIVQAKKSWAWIEEGFVALLAGISVTPKATPIVTTIEQCLLTTQLLVQMSSGGPPETLAEGDHTVENPLWFWHNDVIYLFLTPVATVRVQNMKAVGNWQSINSGESPSPVSLNTLAISVQHNQTDVAAVYAVLPGVPYASNPSIAAKNLTSHLNIVSNTPQVQAVLYEQGEPLLSTLLASVFVASDVNGGKGWTLTGISAPCVVMVGDLGKGLLRFTAANPLSKPLTLSFTIDRSLASASCSTEKSSSVSCTKKADGTSQVTITLEQGVLGGSSTSGCCSAA